MSHKNKIHFTVRVGKKKARCWRAEKVKYRNMQISSGLVSGLGVDTFYLRLDLDGRKPVTFFLRPDEILGVQKVLSTALWAESILKKGEGA